MAPGTGALRLTRAAFFALAAVGLASAAHLAGGDEVSPLASLLAVPAVMLVVNLMATRRRGPGSLFLGMGLTQVALHLAFMFAAAGQSCQVNGGHLMGSMPAGPSGTGSMGAQFALQCAPAMRHGGQSSGQLWPSVPMLLAHLLATALVVGLLAHGEKAVWALAACLSFRLVLPAVGPVLLPAIGRLPAPATAIVRPRPAVHRRRVRRRGPPLVACAVP